MAPSGSEQLPVIGGLTLGAVASFVSFGRVHLPILGLFVAAGLMCAMALGLRTARLARVDPDAFWDLGVATVLSAFVLSRALLVLENLRLFLHFPIAVLELPALSAGGVLLTFAVALWYVRKRELSLIGVLEAGAPCLALFLCFYYLGQFAGGKHEGMPTEVPWAVGSSFGRVHPVELYSAAGWVLVCVALLASLRASQQASLRREVRRGETLGWAMVLYGLVEAVADFFHLPNALYGTGRLDGVEWRGIELIVFGSLLLAWRMAVPGRALADGSAEMRDAL